MLFASAAAAMDTDSLRDCCGMRPIGSAPTARSPTSRCPGCGSIGAEWRVGATDVANEHAATEVVRSWLASVATGLPPSHRGPVVLACAPGEHHTLGLEAFGVMLRARGCEVRMLGADTPGSSLRRCGGDRLVRPRSSSSPTGRRFDELRSQPSGGYRHPPASEW